MPALNLQLCYCVQGRYITVLRVKGQLYAIDSVCFHAGGPLVSMMVWQLCDRVGLNQQQAALCFNVSTLVERSTFRTCPLIPCPSQHNVACASLACTWGQASAHSIRGANTAVQQTMHALGRLLMPANTVTT